MKEGQMKQAKGKFIISFKPLECSLQSGVNTLARLGFSKEFSGDMVGQSQGEMLSCRSTEPGSAGYVAIEILDVVLEGKHGSLVFQHSSTLDQGAPSQSIQVVPNSGTGELAGISGQLEIQIVEGAHFYQFSYQLP